MTRQARTDNRGFILIGAYLALSIFVVYSSGLTMRSLGEGRAAERVREEYQALDLAQGVLNQFHAELDDFLLADVFMDQFSGNAQSTFGWLDDLDASIRQGAALQPPLLTDGTPDSPKCLNGLPTVPKTATACLPTSQTGGQPRAWVSAVADGADPLTERLVTITAEATIGGVTKRIQGTFNVGLEPSDIFRYAYFLNNEGWFGGGSGDQYIKILGDVRSNGDLDFQGNVYLLGDAVATGSVTGNPLEYTGTEQARYNTYMDQKYWALWPGRPTRQLVWDGQPIWVDMNGDGSNERTLGENYRFLPQGSGWDHNNPDQTLSSDQDVLPIPFVGDLDYYEEQARQAYEQRVANGAPQWAVKGATAPGPNGTWGETTNNDDVLVEVDYVWDGYGDDGVPNTPDDRGPLILVGTQQGNNSNHAIFLNGPLVVRNTDVIMRGIMKGQGTMYIDRNLHVPGQELRYSHPPRWIPLERCPSSGGCSYGAGETPATAPQYTIREYDYAPSDHVCRANLGTVNFNGQFTENTANGCASSASRQ